MRCDAARESLSARLDGELSPLEDEALDAHLATCAPCAAHGRRLAALHREVRLQPAPPVPDLTGAITASVRTPRAARPSRVPVPSLDLARSALLVIAGTQLVLALPLLLLGHDNGATTHVARELGAFTVAFAAGLLVVAWQPRRATGMLPFAAALAAAMVLAGAADVVAGEAAAVAEAHHALELGGVGLLWTVARATGAAAGPTLAAA